MLKKNAAYGVPVLAQRLTNPTHIHEDVGLIPGLAQGVKDQALLWLWRRPAAAALIGPLAWEPPYAAGAALKKDKKDKKKKMVDEKAKAHENVIIKRFRRKTWTHRCTCDTHTDPHKTQRWGKSKPKTSQSHGSCLQSKGPWAILLLLLYSFPR